MLSMVPEVPSIKTDPYFSKKNQSQYFLGLLMGQAQN